MGRKVSLLTIAFAGAMLAQMPLPSPGGGGGGAQGPAGPTGPTGPTGATGAAGSGYSFPLTIVQESAQFSGSGTSYTFTFPQTAASSGNTLFFFAALDGNQSITTPSGWTQDFNQAESTYARLAMYHKTSASDTSIAFSYSGETANMSGYFMEVSGSHALDQKSSSGVANTNNLTFPSITPSAGAAVFALACFVTGSASPYPAPSGSLNPLWRPISVQPTLNGARSLIGFEYVNSATNTAITPPQLGVNGAALFASGGVAYATFSIL